jgi:hypothetical protein
MKKDIAAKAIFNGRAFGKSPCNALPEKELHTGTFDI